jgi:hypothetical protein
MEPLVLPHRQQSRRRPRMARLHRFPRCLDERYDTRRQLVAAVVLSVVAYLKLNIVDLHSLFACLYWEREQSALVFLAVQAPILYLIHLHCAAICRKQGSRYPPLHLRAGDSSQILAR